MLLLLPLDAAQHSALLEILLTDASLQAVHETTYSTQLTAKETMAADKACMYHDCQPSGQLMAPNEFTFGIVTAAFLNITSNNGF